jgi:signal transduction histidine kinase/ActR/RegA family two-component response regulator
MMLWIEPIELSAEACLLVLAIDVTNQREAEGQRRQLEEQLRQAQKLEALGTLAGGIAHDFNNILSGIVSLSEVSLLDNPDNQGLQDNLGEVLKASQRAANLIRQILSFSRQDAQDRVSQQLGPVVDEALTLLRATLPTSIEIQRVIDAGLPSVMANSTQIHQVIINLGTNAAYAMKGRKGQLRVRLEQIDIGDVAASRHATLPIGEYVRLSVEDTGAGMEPATIRRVFEPFFTTKPAGEGTGLGLSVVHGIVKEHGGAITVQSEVGSGTALAIYLPALPLSALPPVASVKPMAQGAGQRVLFVDDDASLRSVAGKMLRRLGYEPVVFETAEQVLAAFQAQPTKFDVLVSDLAMPGLSGLELALQMLRIRPGFPIVLASGFGGELTRAEARKLGIVDLVSKPLDFQTLADALERALAPAAN